MNKVLAGIIALVIGLASPVFASDVTKAHLNKPTKAKTFKLNVDNNRTVILRGPVREDNVRAIIDQMNDFSLKGNQDIFMIIDSPGGSVVDGFELIDAIRALKVNKGTRVICAVEAEAYSMAALIALFCNQTYMHKHANIMFHQAAFGVQGLANQVFSRVLFMHGYLQRLHQDIATQMGIKVEEYNDLIEDEWWMGAETAASLGIVDGVLDTLFYTAKPPQTNDFSILFGLEKEPNIVINPLRKVPDNVRNP